MFCPQQEGKGGCLLFLDMKSEAVAAGRHFSWELNKREDYQYLDNKYENTVPNVGEKTTGLFIRKKMKHTVLKRWEVAFFLSYYATLGNILSPKT